ncbi:uncharacterized protein [Antedon mediterranea]|uniref:uncharacterized protein n=1 Tax=Antedon mediterranea TaxID=105859 RepID=UPI003AF5333F
MMPSTILVFILLTTTQVYCQSAVNDTDTFCDVTDPSLLCDPDNILPEDSSEKLCATINEINNGSVCVCDNCTTLVENGYTMAVAMVAELDRDNGGFSVAENLRQEWLNTKTICDDSIVVVYSNYNEQLFIVMGEPLERLISNSTIDQLYEECKSMNSVLECLENTVTKLDEAVTKAIEDEKDNLIWGILGLLAIVTILSFHYYVKDY